MSREILEYELMCGVVVAITIDTDTLSEESEGQNKIDCVPQVCEGKVSSNACYCSCLYLIIKSFKRFIYPVSSSVVAPPRFEPV